MNHNTDIQEIMMRSRLEVEAFGYDQALRLAENEVSVRTKKLAITFDKQKHEAWLAWPAHYAMVEPDDPETKLKIVLP